MKPTKRTGRGIALATMLAAGFAALSIGCQTAIPVSYTEPARFNMAGIKKVGIVSNDNEVTTAVSDALVKTNKYTIASTEEMKAVEAWLQQLEILPEAIDTTAADIIKGYNENEMRANASYQRKILKVTGTITEIKQRAVRLGVGNDTVDVYIKPSEMGRGASLSKGNTVTMLGTCYGLDVPELKDMGELFSILGGGKHVNIANATFYIPEYAGPVDAVLTVNTSDSAKIESRQAQQAAKAADGTTLKDASGKTVYKNVTQYRQIISVNIAYTLMRTHDGINIGSGEASGSAQSDFKDNLAELEQQRASRVSSAKKQPVRKLISDMIPTQRTLSVKLAKSDTQDKDVKNALNEANKLVKSKDYAGAAEAFGKIYAQSKDFAAGYNQAVLTEVALGTDKAVVLMEEVEKTSNREEAKRMLSEMKRRNAANQRAAEQMK